MENILMRCEETIENVLLWIYSGKYVDTNSNRQWKKMYYYEYTVENMLIGTDNGKCITMNRQCKIYWYE